MPRAPREFRPGRAPAVLLAALWGAGLAGCRGRDAGAGEAAAGAGSAGTGGTPAAAVAAPAPAAEAPPDGPPRMVNPDPPFRYPAALYARRVQGNVTLRLWVDSAGQVLPDSTRVSEPSGHPALDSSAVAGSAKLRFRPSIRDGRPAGAAILFPVYFRHPDGAPVPGDSVLRAPRPTPRP